jgi:5-methylcytosine-specific restriction endonuclease McrA
MGCISSGCHRKADRGKECSYHMRIRLYGKCNNGCTTPAQAKHGYCSRCRKRNNNPPSFRPIGLWVNSDSQRYCWSCKKIKNIDVFPLNKSSPFGRGGMCKNCLIKRNNKYDREKIFEYSKKFVQQGVSCAKCQSKDNLEIDHIVPRSIGGTNQIKNLQILCSFCNKSKNNKECIDYRIMI